MIELKIKKANGFSYEQYHSEKEVCKRINQLRDKGINTEEEVKITNYGQ